MHLVAIGGSDAGISAALRARELDPGAEVTVVVADAYPNFSICGIPMLISHEVERWENLAHRTYADLEATGMNLAVNTRATSIDVPGQRLHLRRADGTEDTMAYDELVVGTGALPQRPPIEGFTGPNALGAADGVHLLHSMGDTFDLLTTLEDKGAASALIVGAGYVGLEMAEGLTLRGLQVTQVERLPEVLPTVDPELGRLVHDQLTEHGVEVITRTTVQRISRAEPQAAGRLRVDGGSEDGRPFTRYVDLVLVVVGVRPDTALLTAAGATTGPGAAVTVDQGMRTGLPHVFAAGDCVTTHHRMLGTTYLPLGTTAHKQGKVAGENALGGNARYAGSLGSQVLRVFDVVAGRTGLREHEVTAAGRGWTPLTTQSSPNDHKAYVPGATPIVTRITGDRNTGQLLGAQLVGRVGAEISKRVDTYALALFHEMTVAAMDDLDLTYTPPLGSPWDATQMAAQAWVLQHQPRTASPAHA